MDKKIERVNQQSFWENQPNPMHNESVPVITQLHTYFERRAAMGVQKYGTPLQAHNGRDGLVDLFEELIDAVQYCAQVLIERDGKLP